MRVRDAGAETAGAVVEILSAVTNAVRGAGRSSGLVSPAIVERNFTWTGGKLSRTASTSARKYCSPPAANVLT
eukprot:5734708-Prymnesium_polylepis.1